MTSFIVHAFPNRFNKKSRSFNDSALAAPMPMPRHIQYQTVIRRQTLLFVVLDLHSQMNLNFLTSLRAIHNDIQIFTDISTCFNFVQITEDKIFFISTTNDKQMLEEFHQMKSIEAIFLFNSEAQLDSRFPKLFNVYTHYEELLMDIKDTLEWYEQTQMEVFVFERDQSFLWLQLWKNEFSKLSKSKAALNKTKLIEFAEKYYRGNPRTMQTINEFDETYVKNDVFHWCFTSPFPSRLIQRALYSHDIEQLSLCRFLLIDLAQKFQSMTKKVNCELYKGMKMTADYVDKFEDHVDKLICSRGFLSCLQSRKQALYDANSSDHRPDLMPVLFKISFDKSVSLFEFINRNNDSYFLPDANTVFRVKYVNRSQMTTIKIELANDYGQQFAETYRMKYQSESVDNLLQQLAMPSQTPTTKLPVIQPIKLSVPAFKRRQPVKRNKTPLTSRSLNEIDDIFRISMTAKINLEKQADELLEENQIDEAIATYEQITPPSARIFSRIAAIFAQKKGDYESAIKFYEKALYIQEYVNKEDTTATLTDLGTAYQNCRKYDQALIYHSRALKQRKQMSLVDPVSLGTNLIGIANAYWAQNNLSKALEYAQDALNLNESIERDNDSNIAANLAIIANIYYASGDHMKAIELGERARGLLERCVPSNSSTLATLLNNLATCQVTVGLLSDARENYKRTVKIYQTNLPEQHPKRISAERNLQRVMQMEENCT